MDDQRREITGGGLFIREGKIEQVGIQQNQIWSIISHDRK
jgi:hypothetical protein